MSSPGTGGSVVPAWKYKHNRFDSFSVAFVTDALLEGFQQKFKTTLKAFDSRVLSVRLTERQLQDMFHPDIYRDFVRQRMDFGRRVPGFEPILHAPYTLFFNKSSFSKIEDFDEEAVLKAIRKEASKKPSLILYATGVKYNIQGTMMTLPIPVIDFQMPKVVPKRLKYPRAKSRTVNSFKRRSCSQRLSKGECEPSSARRHGCKWRRSRCETKSTLRRSPRTHRRS